MTALSIGIVGYLAYKSSSPLPPTAAQATLLGLLSGIFQVWAGAIGASTGRADPNFVKSAVTRLTSIGVKAQAAEVTVQTAYESNDPITWQQALGKVSVTTSYLQEEIRGAVQDWKNLHPDAVQAMLDAGNDALSATPRQESSSV